MPKSRTGLGCTASVAGSTVTGEERRGTRNSQRRPGCSHAIQMEKVADAPRDVVIGARRIPADPNATDKVRSYGIETQAAAEHIHASNFLADERIVGLPEILRRSLVGLGGRHGITFLQAKEAASRLHRGVQVRRGERQAGGNAGARAE